MQTTESQTPRPSYVPPDSTPAWSNALLALTQARVLREDADAPPAPSGAERARLRGRIEQVAKTLAGDPEFRGLPGSEAELKTVQRHFEAFVTLMVDDVLALGPLAPLLADPDVTEILVNSTDAVFYERNGVRSPARPFLDETQLRAVLSRLVESSGFHLRDLHPIGEVRLTDGSQLVVAQPPVAPEGPSFCIRRVPRRTPTLAHLVTAGALTAPAATFLAACVRARVNIVVTGGSRAGKSAMLNALANVVPAQERVVVVEDRWQLALTLPNRVTLQTAPGLDLERLIQLALRMQPDRIIVGQCTGPEVLEMLLAMNAGHAGSLTSAFASGPRDLMGRLVMYGHMAGRNLPDAALATQIAAAVDLIVHMVHRPDGVRAVDSITAMVSNEGPVVTISNIFETGPCGKLLATGHVPRFQLRLETSGIPLPSDLYAVR